MEVAPPAAGAAPPTVQAATPRRTRYRAAGAQGPVKFRLTASQAVSDAWYYVIDKLVVATNCSASTRVPGAVVIADRAKRSQLRRFDAKRDEFRIRGRVRGSLARPSVVASVKVRKGGCAGEVISFTASPPR